MTQPKLPWESDDSTVPTASTSELDAPVGAFGGPIHDDPVPSAALPTVVDVQAATRDAVGEAAAKLEQVAGQVVTAQMTGSAVEITTTTMSGQRIRLNDAKNRALRTLVQNLGVDLLVALGTVVPMLLTMSFADKAAWIAFGASVAKTVVLVFTSYVSRLAVEPVIPTPIETPSGVVVQPGVKG